MIANNIAFFDEKNVGGRLPLAQETKARVFHVADSRNGIPERRLRGDRNQCPLCMEYFKSSNAFDHHKAGTIGINRRCLTIVEMLAQRFGKTVDGFWCSPVALKDRERLNRIRSIGRTHWKD